MKKILYYLLMTICICSCAEDHVGQTPTDNVGPAVIRNVEIESMPGGAKVTYELPKETDISYVKGVYLTKGVEHVVRSSVYKNYLLVEGLGSTDPFEITLYTVDHSENLSEPVVKNITPGTPLVKLILESMKIATDFGGIKVTWDNVLASEIGVTVLATDEKGDLVEGETLFTALKDGEYSFRGYDDSKRLFAVCLTDKWGNTSDTIRQEATPYFEKLLDKSKFKRLILPKDNSSDYGAAYNFYKMFDDQIGSGNGWFTTLSSPPLPLYFTIDLGQVAKLSRFKLWHRLGNFTYRSSNMKEFEVWATSAYKENMDEEYWTNGWKNDWEQLGDFVTHKPSGMDGDVTNTDIEYATNGFEFIIPLEAKTYRYIRVVMKSNWSGSSNLEISEMSFYGNDKL